MFLRQVSLLVLGSQQALAAEPMAGRTEIQWEAIQGCPTESAVKTLVEERLGQPIDSPREQVLRFRAKVARNPVGEYEVDLSTTGVNGTIYGQSIMSPI